MFNNILDIPFTLVNEDISHEDTSPYDEAVGFLEDEFGIFIDNVSDFINIAITQLKVSVDVRQGKRGVCGSYYYTQVGPVEPENITLATNENLVESLITTVLIHKKQTEGNIVHAESK